MLTGLKILAATYLGVGFYSTFQRRGQRRVKVTPPAPADDHIQRRRLRRNLGQGGAVVALNTAAHWATALSPVGVLALSVSALPVLRKTEQNLRQGKPPINNDLLNTLVTLGCFATGSYIIGSVMIWFMHLADFMVMSIRDNTRALLTDGFDQAPTKVWVIRDGAEIETPLDSVAAGEILVINTGEVVAVDGMVTAGMASVDQHTLTGESVPVEKTPGDSVYASTLVVSGRLLVRVEQRGTDTAIAKIVHILLHTADFKLSMQTRGEVWADRAALPLLAAGVGLAPFIGLVPALTVLYSGPGNMLKTFVSLQLLSHMTLFSRHGILIKDGRTLERVPQVDTVLFDKTGTLTQDHPEVGEIITLTPLDADTVLRYAAIAEQRLAHPIARAIVSRAQAQGLLTGTIALDAADYQMGYGISVRWAERQIQVGSLRFMAAEGITVAESVLDLQQRLRERGSSLVAVAVDGQLVGILEIATPIRPEAQQVIRALRQRGIQHLAIVSGDHAQPTRHLAEALGLDDYFHDVLPADKGKIVAELQAQGRTVCFIGDGVNDAVAIRQADVSVSLNGATTVATDLAQVVLMDHGLAHLPMLFDVSRQLKARGRESLVVCSSYALSTFFAGAVLRLSLLFPITVGTSFLVVGLLHGSLPLWHPSAKLPSRTTRRIKPSNRRLSQRQRHLNPPQSSGALLDVTKRS